MWFNKVITKVRNFVLRVPSREKLMGLWEGLDVKMLNTNSAGLPHGWDLDDLRRAVEEADRLAAERPIVVEAVKVIDPKYQEYRREVEEERPKFKCKSPNCPEIEMGKCCKDEGVDPVLANSIVKAYINKLEVEGTTASQRKYKDVRAVYRDAHLHSVVGDDKDK